MSAPEDEEKGAADAATVARFLERYTRPLPTKDAHRLSDKDMFHRADMTRLSAIAAHVLLPEYWAHREAQPLEASKASANRRRNRPISEMTKRIAHALEGDESARVIAARLGTTEQNVTRVRRLRERGSASTQQALREAVAAMDAMRAKAYKPPPPPYRRGR